MLRRQLFMGVFVVVFLAGGFLCGDEPKKELPTKAKGQLPSSWGKLGLTDEQRQKIYQTQDEYRAKIAVLERQIKELRRQERKDMEQVLTDGQKQRLREILAGKGPSDDKISPEKKP